MEIDPNTSPGFYKPLIWVGIPTPMPALKENTVVYSDSWPFFHFIPLTPY